jgi:hypothetical protein
VARIEISEARVSLASFLAAKAEAELGVALEDLSVVELLEWQASNFKAWQGSPEREAEREAIAEANRAKVRAAALEKARKRAERDEADEKAALERLAKIRERRELLASEEA